MEATSLLTGEVVTFNDKKGYGFIRREGWPQAQDVFVHFSAILSSAKRRFLQRGQQVEFELREGKKGPVATQVRVISQ